MKFLVAEDLKTAPKGALVKYECQMDGAVWYEPVRQVLEGVQLASIGPDEAHYCPFCDDPAWPSSYLIVTET
jgi:hypothetical protein